MVKKLSDERKPKKKSSPWISHVKAVAKAKKISYKDALKQASKSYKRGK